MQEFEEYLTNKKINPKDFRATEPALWEEWLSLFSKVHPDSFTQQKLFFINSTRRKFPLGDLSETEQEKPTVKVNPKPKFKIPGKPKEED